MKITKKQLRKKIRTLLTENSFTQISVRDIPIDVEIATTPEARKMGLMYRESLATDTGMLFAFPDISERSFWMKDTLIPLSIAYIDEKGTVLNIENMYPHDHANVISAAPASYALEMNQGWFEKNNIAPGDQVSGIKNIMCESREKFKVLGYIKPASAFLTLQDWELVVLRLIDLQNKGIDSRGGEISCKNSTFCSPEDFEEFVQIISKYFGHLLTIEVERYDLLTRKNVLDFIEDFVNHRFWGFAKEFGNYFPNIEKLRFAYFYSRGDIEPYVLLDEEYTQQLYGSTLNLMPVRHFASPAGLERLMTAIENEDQFDISTFTIAERPFFREGSTYIVDLIGNVRAAFRSDIKSVAVDNGRRACNMYRLEYPGRDASNICYDLAGCDNDKDVRTGLWNEYIVTPLEVVSVSK